MTIVMTQFTRHTPRTQKNQFLKKLERKGFLRIQPSIYANPDLDRADTEHLAQDLEKKLPRCSRIHAIFLTHGQWSQAYVLEGPVPQEDKRQLWIQPLIQIPPQANETQ